MSTSPQLAGCPEDEAEREPSLDTWKWKQEAASWLIELSYPNGAAAEANRWWAELLAGTFSDFASLARPREVVLIDEDGATRLSWQPGNSMPAFREEVLRLARSRPTPLVEVQMQVDLCVWFRTADSPHKPVRAWLRSRHTSIEISAHADSHDGYACFSLNHSLFAARSVQMDDNSELHALNQPLLEEALRHWQVRLSGAALSVQGELTGKREFGFSPDPDDYF